MVAASSGRRQRRAQKRAGYVAEQVTDFSAYVKAVEKVKERWWNHWGERVDPWFRGVSDESYSLVPGVYQPPIVDSEDFDEDDYRDEFALRAYRYPQKGMFTIHGRAAKGLEQYRFGNHLVKVVIPRRSATRMMDQLATLGITETGRIDCLGSSRSNTEGPRQSMRSSSVSAC